MVYWCMFIIIINIKKNKIFLILMSKTYLHGSEIVLDNPVEADAQVTIKSKDKIQFNVGGNDVLEITSAGAQIEQTGADLTIDDVLTVNGTTDSTSATTGSIICAGGAGIAKDLFVGGGLIDLSTPFSLDKVVNIQCANGYTSSIKLGEGATNGTILEYSATANRLNFYGINGGTQTLSASLDKNNSNWTFHKRLLINDTTEATNATNGSFQTDGGISCAKSLYVGADIDYVGVLTDVSDKRVKSNIKKLGSNTLEKLKALNPCTFDVNFNEVKKHKSGFIAQELEILFPEVVVKKPTEVNGEVIEDFRRVRETELIPYLVKAIQELADKKENVESLNEDKIDNETIKVLEEKINELQKMQTLKKEKVAQPQIDNEILKAYEEKISNLEKMNEEKTQKIAQLQADVNKLDKNSKKLNLNLVKLLKRVEKMEAQSETNSSIQDF